MKIIKFIRIALAASTLLLGAQTVTAGDRGQRDCSDLLIEARSATGAEISVGDGLSATSLKRLKRVLRSAQLQVGWPANGGVHTADNRHFMDLAEAARTSGEASSLTYFTFEVGPLKELNDHLIKDKGLVTELVNYHKQLIFARIFSDPSFSKLSQDLVGKYSDFKSVRLGFESSGRELEEKLGQLFSGVNRQFVQLFDRAEVHLDQEATSARGLTLSPESWFLAGMGDTSDQADVTARAARVLGGKRLFHFSEIDAWFFEVAEEIENIRKAIQRELYEEFPEIFSQIPGYRDQYVLMESVIEVFMKTRVSGRDWQGLIRQVQSRVEKRFAVSLSIEQVASIRNYLNLADRFSPGIYMAKRTQIDLAQAKSGIVSVDFAGQNVRNMYQTLLALHESRGLPASDVLKWVRVGEQTATEDLDRRKDFFRSAIKRSFPRQSHQVYFSGDDGIFMPTELLGIQKLEVISKLARFDDPKTFRMTFVPEGVPMDHRALLLVEAENIEKALRLYLEGRLSEAWLSQLVLVPDMVTSELGSGLVNLFVGGTADEQVLKIIEEELSRVLSSCGYDLGSVESAAAWGPWH